MGSTGTGRSPSPPASPQAGRAEKQHQGRDDGASILGHRLQSPWTFWFSRKDKKRSNSITAGPSGTVVIDKKQDKKEHMDNLVQIGTCRTVEEFWQYAHRFGLKISVAGSSLLLITIDDRCLLRAVITYSYKEPALCLRRAISTFSETNSSQCGRYLLASALHLCELDL